MELRIMKEFAIHKLSQADETMRHKLYMSALKIGCGDYTTTQGRDKLNEAVNEYLTFLTNAGYLKIPTNEQSKTDSVVP